MIEHTLFNDVRRTDIALAPHVTHEAACGLVINPTAAFTRPINYMGALPDFYTKRAGRSGQPSIFYSLSLKCFLTAAKDLSLITCSILHASSCAVFSSTPSAISILVITVCRS